MDKSLDSVHYADELMALFPNMLFLNVVRDPRAQVASMNRAIIHDFDSELNARTWLAAHRAADAVMARYPARVLTIRYEDFLTDQEAVLKKICAFLEIDYLPQMLDVGASSEAKQISQLSALWSSNCFAPIAANADKFKQQLGMDEIALIETLTRPYMERYGYQCMSAGKAAVDAAADAASSGLAMTRSEIGRAQAWRAMETANFRDFILRRYRADYLAKVRARMELHLATAPAPDVPLTLEALDPASFSIND